MPNVLLTQKCVRSCPYCFAKKHMSDSEPKDILSWEDLIYLTDFLASAGEYRISLLGGEPTLHPDFIDMVLYLIQRNFQVLVFTCGIMSDQKHADAVKAFKTASQEKLSFVCNLNHPDQSSTSETQKIERFLRAFGPYVAVGYNIHETDFDIHFLFDYINSYGLKRFLRLGLAHPIPGMNNTHIPVADLPKMAEKLASYLPLFERFRVRPGFDCGLPVCLFTDEQLGRLFKANGGDLKFGCGPAIDIGPDMTVWSCFPLSEFHKKSIFEFDSFPDVINHYLHLQQALRVESGGIFEKCDDCRYREEGLCSGGCLAHLLNNIRNEAKVRVPEVYG
jgi:radical SAM protein with 4Fe4S-binding SPASM domain